MNKRSDAATVALRVVTRSLCRGIDLLALLLGVFIDNLLHILRTLFVGLQCIKWRAYIGRGFGLRFGRLARAGGECEQA